MLHNKVDFLFQNRIKLLFGLTSFLDLIKLLYEVLVLLVKVERVSLKSFVLHRLPRVLELLQER